jgi:hypothetical protein
MLLLPVVHDIRKRLCLFEVSQVSSACHSAEYFFYCRTKHVSLIAYRPSVCQDIRYNQERDKKTKSNKMGRSMVHFWKNTERANRKFWEKNLSQYYSVQHKFHMDWFGMEPEIVSGFFAVRDRRLTF